MSVQYTAIFHGCKNVNFQMKKCYIFLIFAQNIDCGYTLEPPQKDCQFGVSPVNYSDSMWNSLPSSVGSSKTIEEFKAQN